MTIDGEEMEEASIRHRKLLWSSRDDHDPEDPFKAMTRFYDERVTRKGGRSIFRIGEE